MNVQDELSHLQKCAEIGKHFKNADLEHLDSPSSAYNYIRIADVIAGHARRETSKPTKFLDWGSGYGQLAWLLKNRGVNAAGYNVEKREHVDEIPLLSEINAVYNSDPIKLPFEDESFDGIISCGVLEHVSDPVVFERNSSCFKTRRRAFIFSCHIKPRLKIKRGAAFPCILFVIPLNQSINCWNSTVFARKIYGNLIYCRKFNRSAEVSNVFTVVL